jgi:hypothetical protein
MSTLILRPNSDNTVEQSLSSGSDAYALVDEATLSTSDYCQGTGAYKLNLYGFPNHTTEEGIINRVTVTGVLAKESASYTGTFKMAVKIGSTIYYLTESTLIEDPGISSRYWNNNPSTGVKWTWAEIDNLVAGCALYTSAGWARDYQLYVTVTYNVIPTVTTQACSLVSMTTATFNGTITATPDVNVTQRGFVYMLGNSGDPTVGGAGCTDVNETGSWGASTFYQNVTGLTENTDYRVRAYAINSSGTSYGTTVDMKTIGAGFFLVF